MREQDTLENRIKSLESMLRDIKNVQFSGTSNVISYESQTADEWDIDETINFSTGERRFYFFFTADTQKAPFVSFHPLILVDDIEYDASTIEADLTYGFNLYDAFTSDVDFEKTVGVLLSFYDNDDATVNVKVKMRAVATDTGTITLEVVS